MAPRIFLTGSVRSGTTMLRLMMNSHPSICDFGEFEYSVKDAPATGWLDHETYKTKIEADRHFSQLDLTIPEGADQKACALDFWEQHRAKTDKPILSATVHSQFHRLPELWPDARYIYLRRDPRDVARSCVQMGWGGNTFAGASFWVDAEERLEKLQQQVAPENILMVRYEDVLENVEHELTRICEFIGVPYSDKMLTYPETSTYSAVDPSLSYQWKRKQSESDIRQTEALVGDRLQAAGYEPSGLPPLNLSPDVVLGLKVKNRVVRLQNAIKREGIVNWTMFKYSHLLPAAPGARSIRAKKHQIEISRLK
ncbi:MAG: sulfotransferase [Pseudomonadota bacterium]